MLLLHQPLRKLPSHQPLRKKGTTALLSATPSLTPPPHLPPRKRVQPAISLAPKILPLALNHKTFLLNGVDYLKYLLLHPTFLLLLLDPWPDQKKLRDICEEITPCILSMEQTSNKGSIYDASTHTLQTLLKIRNNDNTRFVNFDFTYCSQKTLNRLFPVTIEERYLLIPPTFRSSASSIRNFQQVISKKDKLEYLSSEKVKLERIEEASILSHIDDIDYDLCNGISLHYLRYISKRKTPFKSSELGFKHLIRESIVELGVRVTQD